MATASAISLSLSFSKYPLKTLPLPSSLRPTTVPPPLINLHPRPALILRDRLDDVEDSVLNPPAAADLGKSLLWAVLWASVSVFAFTGGGDARAAADSSIKASGFGVRIAGALRGSGWPNGGGFRAGDAPGDRAPGAIPVGYWMRLDPVMLTVLSIIGNMVPVPLIVLYSKKLASFLARKNQAASQFVDMLFQRAKEKAGPVEEFQWFGLIFSWPCLSPEQGHGLEPL